MRIRTYVCMVNRLTKILMLRGIKHLQNFLIFAEDELLQQKQLDTLVITKQFFVNNTEIPPE